MFIANKHCPLCRRNLGATVAPDEPDYIMEININEGLTPEQVRHMDDWFLGREERRALRRDLMYEEEETENWATIAMRNEDEYEAQHKEQEQTPEKRINNEDSSV